MSTTAGQHRRLEVSDLTLAMAEAARLAPSVHNTQPWRFEPLPDGLSVHEDTSRALPSLDPLGRERAISCATAVTNAALTVAKHGLRPRVELADPTREDATAGTRLVATVRAGERTPPSDADLRRYAAIATRRAHRRLHATDPVSPEDVEALCEAVVGEGARPFVPDAGARRRLGALLRAAVRHQLEDPRHIAEVDSWIRHPGDPGHTEDGLPVGSLGTTPYPADSIVHDGWDPQELDEIPVEEELATSTVIAIATRGDTRRDWLVAGMALERLWLEAAARDLAVTFADQATQWAETRDRAAQVLATVGELQLVVRVGHPLVDVPATPRRPLDDLWLIPPG